MEAIWKQLWSKFLKGGFEAVWPALCSVLSLAAPDEDLDVPEVGFVRLYKQGNCAKFFTNLTSLQSFESLNCYF